MFANHKVELYLKSGRKYTFRCKHWSMTYRGSDMTGYKITGAGIRMPDHINMDQIEMVITKPTLWVLLKQLFRYALPNR